MRIDREEARSVSQALRFYESWLREKGINRLDPAAIHFLYRLDRLIQSRGWDADRSQNQEGVQ